LAVLLYAVSAAAGLAGIAPEAAPATPDDLKVTGLFAGVPAGGAAYVSRATLLGVPGVAQLHEPPADSIAPGDLTVLPLNRFLQALPVAGDADAIILVGADRWESVIPVAFINRVHPYLLLKYDGRIPAEGWPRFGPNEALAPYYCGESAKLGPVVPTRMEYGEFDATQVVEIRAINLAAHYAPFYSAALAKLSPAAVAGRKLFIAECNNCHQGPAMTGGNTSQRPLSLLEVHAALNTAYFRSFVRNPRQIYPQTVMPTHEYFTEEMMNQLIAFLSEARAAGVN